MRVYEIGLADHYDECSEGVDCTTWIAVEKGIDIRQIKTSSSYIKPLPENLDEHTPGVDFVVQFTARPRKE